eukprot:10555954-Alexandrium_andersonii.AAC.1
MSASLVGSEMCIRDSRGTFSEPSRGPPGHPRGPSEPRKTQSSRQRLEGCLLYTSDAADDM